MPVSYISSMLTLSALFIYPIKSCAALTLDAAPVEPRGLRYDRRWMLVDATSRFMTQRLLPHMALIDVEVEGMGLRVRAPGMDELHVSPFDDGTREWVEIWDDTVEAAVAPDDVNAWFSRFLDRPCRLVYMPPDSVRPVDPEYAKGGEEVSFADAFPMLLATETSLADLNNRLAEPVTILRFRPNLVIAGTLEPFEEDTWKEIRIGEVRFDVVKPCARCAVVNVDPATGLSSREPLRTLASYRTVNNKALFAQNLIPLNTGTIRVGDEVEILSTRP